MHKIIEEIKELLDNKSLTSYRIGKEAGISVQQVDRYRKTAKIENIPLKNALKLQQYYKKTKRK
nr:MAG TPA: Stage III sporulation protein D [Caudoviricetes sp.]